MNLIVVVCPNCSTAVSVFREFAKKYSRYVVKANRASLEVTLVENAKVKFIVDNKENLLGLGLRCEFMYMNEFVRRYMNGCLYN